MSVPESLATLRPNWISKISHRLARGVEVRESFLFQLNRFYDLLQQAIITGDPEWMNPVLDEWVDSRTQTELEDRETSLPPLLSQILLISYEAAQESLNEEDALEIIGALLPVFTYSFQYTTQTETERHIDHISHEVEKAKNTLERLDKSKSDFIAIAAHELKTPLTLIEGYASMLREQLIEHRNGTSTEVLLQGIGNGTHRLREIVDDMIDVSMIDNDLLSLNYQPVWIYRLLGMIREEFSSSVSERRLDFEVANFPGSNEMTFGDAERLFQALRNVISNAIKFTPDGGKIHVNGRKLPGFLEITVADSGIGIEPEDQGRIFEKFGRVGNVSLHSSGKTKFKGGGPGLGLPIAKGIIEAHGGTIWAESEGYDEVNFPGTVFHILLPLRKEPPDDKSARLFRLMTDKGSKW